MKKMMNFFNYLVGSIALFGLAGGITYGMYTAGGVIGAGITGIICLGMLVVIGLGTTGRFNEKDEKGFPAHFSMILVIGSGILILFIGFGAGLTSLHENLPSPAPVTHVSETPSPVSTSPIATETPSPSSVATTPNSHHESGISPYLIALLVALAVIIILIYILKSGDLSGIGWY